MNVPLTYRPLVGWRGPFTSDRRFSPFKASWSDTMNVLDRELWHLDAKDVVLQLALRESDIRLDGYPRSNARAPEHPGVAIAFSSRYGALWYQTDVFTSWQANVRAIALGLEALRKVDRYGITKRGEQYAGWKALPGAGGSTSTMTLEIAATVLAGYSEWTREDVLADLECARSAYRDAAKRTHPDQGGSADAFGNVQTAWRIVSQHHAGRP